MARKKNAHEDSIAVIGMACVYPGAHSPEELWRNVLAGRRYFRKAPPERLPRADYFDADPDAPGKTYSDQMALITGWSFDPVAFRIPPVTVEASDIAHWLALFTARSAIADAALKLESIDRSRVGVILGNTLTGEFSRSHMLRFRWPYVRRALLRALEAMNYSAGRAEEIIEALSHFYNSPLPEITEDSLAGNMSNIIAGRICNYFDFGAGGFTVDGACSSSLLAVSHACTALVNREMDYAITGGVDISIDPFEVVGFAKTRALAVDDIRPYDERAAGMLPGEGCGIVVLAREEDARKQGRRIHALIRGWGYSSDGAGGITAPEVEGQIRAIRKTYERAGYPVSTVNLIEGHGTGTMLGDKIEIAALRQMIEESEGQDFCWLGSIKGNIGHCKAAAGAAGLIKAVMALKHKILPPSGNCRKPSPEFGRPMGRLRPTIRGVVWQQKSYPRRAAVSAMGFGGANSHVTLEEANPNDAPPQEDLAILGSNQETELVLISAQTADHLMRKVEHLLSIAERICRAELTDLSAALAKEPLKGDIRLAIVTDDPRKLAGSLKAFGAKLSEGASPNDLDDPDAGIFAGKAKKHPTLVGLFPGQGSQIVNMGEYLLQRYPFVVNLYERADKALTDIIPEGIKSHILLNPYAFAETIQKSFERNLQDTRITQPTVVLSSIATLNVLGFLGLKPDTVIGHSLGEISAYHAAGVYSDIAALRIAAARGRAMASLTLNDPGGMAAVGAAPDVVERLIAPFEKKLIISNYNSPRQTVVSGESDAIDKIVELCRSQGIRSQRLPVSHAFHSHIVAPAAKALRTFLEGLEFRNPSSATISTISAQQVKKGSEVPELLIEQISKPVRFVDAVERAAERKPDLWVEIGPGGVLTALVRSILGNGKALCFPTNVNDEDSSLLLNNVLAKAFVLGFPVARERLFAHRYHRPFSLDSYHPQFIVNPCERAVPAIERRSTSSDIIPATLMPGEADGAALEHYLASRGQFLRDFITLDFRHFQEKAQTGGSEAAPAPDSDNAREKPVVQEKGVAADPETILRFAIDWISGRTGFPVSSISADMKLREDLNLDSIKAGELAISLSRKFGGVFRKDPSTLANATVSALVEALEIKSFTEKRRTRADVAPVHVTTSYHDLPDRIRTFSVVSFPIPLEHEKHLPLPAGSRVIIMNDSHAARAEAIARELQARGHTVTVLDSSVPFADGEMAQRATAIIYILKAEEKTFFTCTPAEFVERVEGFGTRLFHLFHDMVRSGESADTGFRALVLRPFPVRSDKGTDIDGVGGFLRTLALEHEASLFKWVSLPDEWTPDQWAATALAELETTGKRVVFRYGSDGTRMSEGAERIDVSGQSPFALEKDEVILVSGGAKGITSELVLGLARKTGAKLALLGSSPLPLQRTDDQAAEILDKLERYRKEGIPFKYYQCDVTDLISVQRTVKSIEKELGPIAAIFHGAGISQLKLFRDMDVDSFLKVVRVKVRGLYNLIVTVDAVRLRALHVISSVLGRTGMKGQADYTLANAWLESAVKSVKAAFPHIHCLSLGYSVWADAGLGKKLGVVDMLSSFGVTPISTREGVDAYLELLRNSPDAHNFVITGRMSPQLEANLFVPPVHLDGRFLERIIRWIPGGEIVAEATVSHATDLYLAEHVFEGTPVFPAVMAIDAMVQAAAACTGKTELPILRNIGFHRPLIVPESTSVVLRTIAVVDSTEENMIRVKVLVRSDDDRFRENHFEAECLFVNEPLSGNPMPVCPVLGKKLPLNPEDFNPEPLFQGKFFRRISGVYKIEELKESITEVTVPMGERYFRNTNGTLAVLTSPAVRDAFLQSGALLLPFGYLPVSIEEIGFSRKITPGTRIICHCTGNALHDSSFTADIAAFSQDGELLETIRGVHLIAPKMKERVRQERASSPVAVSRVEDDMRTLLPEFPVAVAVIEHASLDTLTEISEISERDRQRIGEKHAPPRQVSAMANLAATRRAAVAYAQRYLNLNMSPHRIALTSHQDGKPELHFDEVALSEEFRGIDVSLADGFGMSIAVVGPAPVGVDIEQVESRDAELWYGLLGEDGYNLGRRLAESSGESFDKAATRVWTVLESGKKVNGLNRIVPNLQENLNGNWLSLSTSSGGSLLFLSALLATGSGPKDVAALTVVLSKKAKPGTQRPAEREDTRGAPPETNGRTPEKIRSLRVAIREEQEFEHVMDGFVSFLQKAKVEFQDDPDSRNLERHYQQYSTLIIETTEALRRIQDSLPSGSVYQKQRRMYDAVRPFCEESIIFKRALDKPLGYPGDFLLLDMMFSSVPSSRGLGYHFDRYFLTYSGTEAVRQRSYWVISRVLDMFSQRKTKTISLLDLGCGPMTIEKILLEQMPPDGRLTLTGFDFDGLALEYARARLDDPRVTVAVSQKNLVSPEGISEIRRAAAQADVCICMGLIEYISDESAAAVFEALFEGSRPATRIFTSNYRSGHYAQTAMEWFIDWWLMYRTEEDLMRILKNSGFDEHHMKTSRDSTNSLVFLDVQR